MTSQTLFPKKRSIAVHWRVAGTFHERVSFQWIRKSQHSSASARLRHLIVTKLLSSRNISPSADLHSQEGWQMDLTLEDLHHRLDQLRFLATQTDDPLAERLVRDLIVELEDRLTADRTRASQP